MEEIEGMKPQMEKRARRMKEPPQVEEALEFADRLVETMQAETPEPALEVAE